MVVRPHTNFIISTTKYFKDSRARFRLIQGDTSIDIYNPKLDLRFYLQEGRYESLLELQRYKSKD